MQIDGKVTSTSVAREREGQQVTLLGALVNLVLSLLKVVGGLLAHSAALVADGVHSLADLISDGLVLLLYKHANRKPDVNHPWGHARFETLGSIAVAVLLALIGLVILWQSGGRLVEGAPPVLPGWLALVIAAASLLAKEGLYQYTMRVARRHDSRLLAANAWHHRTDMFTSGLVFIAIIGAMLGWWWLDAVGAILVSLLLLWLAGKMLFDSLAELVDTALPPEEVEHLGAMATQVENVLNVHDLKTRRAGPQTLLEMHIQVPTRTTAAEAHHIGHQVLQKLRQERSDLAELIYHIDVEPPATGAKPDPQLPEPQQIRERMQQLLANQVRQQPEMAETQRAEADTQQPDWLTEVDIYMLRAEVWVEVKLAPGWTLAPGAQQEVRAVLAAELPHVTQVKFWQQL